MALSYKKAVAAGLLKDVDKERLVCAFLAVADQVKRTGAYGQIAAELGMTRRSVECIPALLKKLRDAGCFIDGESSSAAGAPAAPKPKGKKRKATEEDSGVDMESASKKAKGGKRDTAVEVKVEADLEADDKGEF